MKRFSQVFALVLLSSLVLISPAFAPTTSEITLNTSRACYASGDTVAFTLTNNSDSVFWVSHLPVWSIRDVAADSLVYPLFVYWVFVSLDTNQSATYQWNQRDYHGTQVPAGTYLVRVSGTLGKLGQAVTVADTFDIGGASQTVPDSWGSVKSRW
jgi:hypothetical protein